MSETEAPKALHRRNIDHQAWLHQNGLLAIESR
jgi:hypothetical protein